MKNNLRKQGGKKLKKTMKNVKNQNEINLVKI